MKTLTKIGAAVLVGVAVYFPFTDFGAGIFSESEEAILASGSRVNQSSRDGEGKEPTRKPKSVREKEMMRSYYLPQTMEEVSAERDEYLRRHGSFSKLWEGTRGSFLIDDWTSVGPLGIYDVSETVDHSGRVISFDMYGDNPNIMFCGAASGGLWKSVDAGLSWVNIMDTLACPSVSSIACTQLSSDSTVWFSTGSRYNGAGVQIGRLYRSTNGGTTWTNISLPTGNIIKIEINPFNKNIVFVASETGLFRTTTGGSSWLYPGSGGTVSDVITYTNLITPDTTTVLMARESQGIYRSTNNGTNFSPVTLPGYDAAVDHRITLATNPATPNRTFALVGKTDGTFLGIWFSTDKGATWVQKTLPTSNGAQSSYNQGLGVTTSRVFVGYNAGVTFYSTNDGNTWSQSTWTHPDVHKIHPYNNTLIYQINDGGVFRSTNSGATWNTFGNKFLQIAQAYALYTSATLPNTVWIGTQDNGVAAGYDDSFGWTGLTCCDGGVYFHQGSFQYMSLEFGSSTALHRLQRKLISAPVTDPWQGFAQGIQPGSTVFGSLPPKDFFYDGSRFYTSMGNLVYQRASTDTSWSQLGTTSPFGSDGVAKLGYSALFVLASRETPTAPIARRYNPLSNNWEDINLSSVPGGSVVTDFEKGSLPNNVFMSLSGTSGARVFKSTNSGATWSNITGNLPNLINVRLLLTNKTNDNIIYAGSDFGVFATSNGGTTWFDYSNGLPRVCYVNGLSFENNGNNLYVATYGRGVFKSQVLTTSVGSDEGTPMAYSLSRNYPNPFNPSTVIVFELPTRDEVTIQAFDINGKLVRNILQNQSYEPGKHEVRFDAGDLASGTYIYKLTTPGYSFVRKMILLK